jgi:hypothetical protein
VMSFNTATSSIVSANSFFSLASGLLNALN